MTPIEHAIDAYMAHPDMACDDPLTDSLLAQVTPQPGAPGTAPGAAYTSDAGMLAALQRIALRSHAVARREYTHGWAWGVACGLTAGVCATGIAVWLWHLVAIWLCPRC